MRRLYAATRRAPAHERCELCAAPIAADHEHLYAPANRTVRCACTGCALIIPTSSSSGYLRVPRGTRRIEVADVAGWLDRLAVPVGIAALIRRDDRAIIGYPGAAGLVEAAVEPAIWDQLVRELPLAATLEPEVEALVWSRLGGDRVLRVGIDVVFRLIGELRQHWEGITGGPNVVGTVERVLSELHAEAA